MDNFEKAMIGMLIISVVMLVAPLVCISNENIEIREKCLEKGNFTDLRTSGYYPDGCYICEDIYWSNNVNEYRTYKKRYCD